MLSNTNESGPNLEDYTTEGPLPPQACICEIFWHNLIIIVLVIIYSAHIWQVSDIIPDHF